MKLQKKRDPCFVQSLLKLHDWKQFKRTLKTQNFGDRFNYSAIFLCQIW